MASPDIDLALLYHDAVYAPLSSCNELESAALLVEEGRRAWIDERILQRARALVLATAHTSDDACESEQARIVVDADLSILGADRSRFDAYEADVRDEYAVVGDDAFCAGRAAILRALLARPSIYATARARRLWEARARQNLEASLARLDGAQNETARRRQAP